MSTPNQPQSAGEKARITAHRFCLKIAAETLKPEPVLGLADWCEKNISMPIGAPIPGPWRTDVVPAAVPIYAAWNDPTIREIIIRGPTQTLKSALMINALLYEAATFPGPFAIYQPDKSLARKFSQTRIPEVAAGTRLAPYFQRTARGATGEGGTLSERHFPGGTCKIVGVGDTSALISDPIRVVMIDEITQMTGIDVIGLSNDRMTTFPDARRFIASSPGDEGICPITAEYNRGDRREWNARCSTCGELQPLEWERVHFLPRDPESARYECSGCGVLWHDDDLLQANRAGEYIASAEFKGIASFTLNALASPLISMSHLAREWIDAIEHLEATGEISKVKTFTRSRMAKPWADRTRRLDADEIMRTTAVNYPAEYAPPGVLAITMAVDVQDDRLEVELAGWGIADIADDDLKLIRAVGEAPAETPGETRHALRRWGLGYHTFIGDPSAPEIWRKMHALYKTQIRINKDLALDPNILLIDSGGHYTDRVRDFVAGRGHGRENIFPVKGASQNDAAIVRVSKSRDMLDKYQNSLYLLGTFSIKEIVYRHLSASRHMTSKTKLYNYPRHGKLGYEQPYFEGLTSEEKINRRNRDGQVRAAWVCAEGRNNEPLDLACYNYAAIRILGGAEYLARRREIIDLKTASSR